MKERPILFSAPMVRAILDGRKTQTRRITSDPGCASIFWHKGTTVPHGEYEGWVAKYERQALLLPRKCSYGIPGDRLYVKEAVWVWCHKKPNGTTKKGRPKFCYVPHSSRSFFYVADHPNKPERTSYADPDMVWRYKTARFMPRWASRIMLEVIDVRVQRVQEISEEDARAEGADRPVTPEERQQYNIIDPSAQWTGRIPFRWLWDSINAKKYPWASNPWVWAISFRAIDLPA